MTYRAALHRALRTWFQTFGGSLAGLPALDALSRDVAFSLALKVAGAALSATIAAAVAFSMNLGEDSA